MFISIFAGVPLFLQLSGTPGRGRQEAPGLIDQDSPVLLSWALRALSCALALALALLHLHLRNPGQGVGNRNVVGAIPTPVLSDHGRDCWPILMGNLTDRRTEDGTLCECDFLESRNEILIPFGLAAPWGSSEFFR